MKDLIKKILVWFFSVIVCGILVGFLGNRVYYEYFEKTSMAYASNTFRLAYKDNDLRKKLKITINGKNVNELYITTITLINNGNTTLSREDFRAETDPLRIEGKHIESVFVDKINTTVNSKVTLYKRRGGMRLNFKWINPGDVIVLKVVHHRPSDNIRVRGSFKGVSRIGHITDNYDKFICGGPSLIRTFIFSVFGIMLIILTIFGFICIVHKIKYGCLWMTPRQKAMLYMITDLSEMSRKETENVKKRICRLKSIDGLEKLYNEYKNKMKK